LDPNYKKIVQKAWSGHSAILDPWQKLSRKIASCQEVLQQWQYQSFGQSKLLFQKQCDKLVVMQWAENRGNIQKLQDDLHLQMEQEDIK
jgi:hypothetical protein